MTSPVIDRISPPFIVTHRGLEPDNAAFLHRESSPEAFRSHLTRGFGIEFDVVFSRDLQPFIWHDCDIARISAEKDRRRFDDLMADEVRDAAPDLMTLQDILALIRTVSSSALKALHLKGHHQSEKNLEVLADILGGFEELHKNMLVFDLTIDAASCLRKKLRDIHLAPSVAHPFDIERYSKCVSDTLYSLDAVLPYRHVFDWIWLDEWDRADVNGRKKAFYTRDIIESARSEGFSVALVSPELHSSSPALAGGEAHEDGGSIERVLSRAKDLVSTGADAICTDYPEMYSKLIR